MWRTLRRLREWPEDDVRPSHPGLAYSRWAPPEMLLKADNKQSAEARDSWLKALCEFSPSDAYTHAFDRWKKFFECSACSIFFVKAESRLLLGYGNPSPTEVGLTLHHTWGVPVLPGSSLKGLTASYVEATYGPAPDLFDDGREDFRGVEWRERRPVRPPGDAYRRLFGAPDVDVDKTRVVSTQGKVIFHDALWVPGCVASGQVLARDVLTVHQSTYYSAKEDSTPWPCDFDDPIPVSFLTVAPGNCFLVALEVSPGVPGGDVLLQRARRYLQEALVSWGVGGKTAAGYGRFKEVSEREASHWRRDEKEPDAPVRRRDQRSELAVELETWIHGWKARDVAQRPLFRKLEEEWMGRLVTQSAESLQGVAKILADEFKLKKGDEVVRLEALLGVIRGVTG